MPGPKLPEMILRAAGVVPPTVSPFDNANPTLAGNVGHAQSAGHVCSDQVFLNRVALGPAPPTCAITLNPRGSAVPHVAGNQVAGSRRRAAYNTVVAQFSCPG
jgi:hypothetical protein